MLFNYLSYPAFADNTDPSIMLVDVFNHLEFKHLQAVSYMSTTEYNIYQFNEEFLNVELWALEAINRCDYVLVNTCDSTIGDFKTSLLALEKTWYLGPLTVDYNPRKVNSIKEFFKQITEKGDNVIL